MRSRITVLNLSGKILYEFFSYYILTSCASYHLFVRFAILHSIKLSPVYNAKFRKCLGLHVDACVIEIEFDLFASLRLIVIDIFIL